MARPGMAHFAYEPFAQASIARLEEARLEVLEDRIDADLATGELQGSSASSMHS